MFAVIEKILLAKNKTCRREVNLSSALRVGEMTTYRTGSDGKKITIPPGYTSRQGSDGRVVAIPKGYTSRQGSDGRVIAIPPGRTAYSQPNGRLKLR